MPNALSDVRLFALGKEPFNTRKSATVREFVRSPRNESYMQLTSGSDGQSSITHRTAEYAVVLVACARVHQVRHRAHKRTRVYDTSTSTLGAICVPVSWRDDDGT